MGRYGSSVGGEKQAESGYMMKVVLNCWTDYSLGENEKNSRIITLKCSPGNRKE